MEHAKPVEGNKISIDIEIEINGKLYQYHLGARIIGEEKNRRCVGKLRKI